MPDPTQIATIIAVTLSTALFLLYHVLLLHQIRTHPARTVYGLSKSSRRIWVASIMFRKQDILAIQTLRNYIMGSSFMASTSVAICFGFIAFLASARIGSDGAGLDVQGAFIFAQDGLFVFKVVALLTCLIFTFLSFTQSIRYYNHVALMININITDQELAEIHPSAHLARKTLTKDRVADVLNRGAVANTIGLRGYYISFPIVAWMFGAWYLLGCMVVVVIAMGILDFNVEWMVRREPLDGLGHERPELMRAAGMSGTTTTTTAAPTGGEKRKEGEQEGEVVVQMLQQHPTQQEGLKNRGTIKDIKQDNSSSSAALLSSSSESPASPSSLTGSIPYPNYASTIRRSVDFTNTPLAPISTDIDFSSSSQMSDNTALLVPSKRLRQWKPLPPRPTPFSPSDDPAEETKENRDLTVSSSATSISSSMASHQRPASPSANRPATPTGRRPTTPTSMTLTRSNTPTPVLQRDIVSRPPTPAMSLQRDVISRPTTPGTREEVECTPPVPPSSPLHGGYSGYVLKRYHTINTLPRESPNRSLSSSPRGRRPRGGLDSMDALLVSAAVDSPTNWGAQPPTQPSNAFPSKPSVSIFVPQPDPLVRQQEPSVTSPFSPKSPVQLFRSWTQRNISKASSTSDLAHVQQSSVAIQHKRGGGLPLHKPSKSVEALRTSIISFAERLEPRESCTSPPPFSRSRRPPKKDSDSSLSSLNQTLLQLGEGVVVDVATGQLLSVSQETVPPAMATVSGKGRRRYSLGSALSSANSAEGLGVKRLSTLFLSGRNGGQVIDRAEEPLVTSPTACVEVQWVPYAPPSIPYSLSFRKVGKLRVANPDLQDPPPRLSIDNDQEEAVLDIFEKDEFEKHVESLLSPPPSLLFSTSPTTPTLSLPKTPTTPTTVGSISGRSRLSAFFGKDVVSSEAKEVYTPLKPDPKPLYFDPLKGLGVCNSDSVSDSNIQVATATAVVKRSVSGLTKVSSISSTSAMSSSQRSKAESPIPPRPTSKLGTSRSARKPRALESDNDEEATALVGEQVMSKAAQMALTTTPPSERIVRSSIVSSTDEEEEQREGEVGCDFDRDPVDVRSVPPRPPRETLKRDRRERSLKAQSMNTLVSKKSLGQIMWEPFESVFGTQQGKGRSEGMGSRRGSESTTRSRGRRRSSGEILESGRWRRESRDTVDSRARRRSSAVVSGVGEDWRNSARRVNEWTLKNRASEPSLTRQKKRESVVSSLVTPAMDRSQNASRGSLWWASSPRKSEETERSVTLDQMSRRSRDTMRSQKTRSFIFDGVSMDRSETMSRRSWWGSKKSQDFSNKGEEDKPSQPSKKTSKMSLNGLFAKWGSKKEAGPAVPEKDMVEEDLSTDSEKGWKMRKSWVQSLGRRRETSETTIVPSKFTKPPRKRTPFGAIFPQTGSADRVEAEDYDEEDEFSFNASSYSRGSRRPSSMSSGSSRSSYSESSGSSEWSSTSQTYDETPAYIEDAADAREDTQISPPLGGLAAEVLPPPPISKQACVSSQSQSKKYHIERQPSNSAAAAAIATDYTHLGRSESSSALRMKVASYSNEMSTLAYPPPLNNSPSASTLVSPHAPPTRSSPPVSRSASPQLQQPTRRVSNVSSQSSSGYSFAPSLNKPENLPVAYRKRTRYRPPPVAMDPPLPASLPWEPKPPKLKKSKESLKNTGLRGASSTETLKALVLGGGGKKKNASKESLKNVVRAQKGDLRGMSSTETLKRRSVDPVTLRGKEVKNAAFHCEDTVDDEDGEDEVYYRQMNHKPLQHADIHTIPTHQQAYHHHRPSQPPRVPPKPSSRRSSAVYSSSDASDLDFDPQVYRSYPQPRTVKKVKSAGELSGKSAKSSTAKGGSIRSAGTKKMGGGDLLKALWKQVSI
ncbi:hypothetical protein HDV05_003191 [Chytridiales sp. JEL 0842]|nr:hypothetical protein HDV05_003191 [Chytridiales sp. JEL 0842]